MAITPYLKGPYYFDLETRRALGAALEMACIALYTGDDDEHVRRTIANKLTPWPRRESVIPMCCANRHWRTSASRRSNRRRARGRL
jgi:hypothetical protein